MIEMYWSLLQMEKVGMESSDPTRSGVRLINRQNLSFLNRVHLDQLQPRHFLYFKLVVCLAKLYSDSQEHPDFQLGAANNPGIDFDGIFAKFENLTPEARSR